MDCDGKLSSLPAGRRRRRCRPFVRRVMIISSFPSSAGHRSRPAFHFEDGGGTSGGCGTGGGRRRRRRGHNDLKIKIVSYCKTMTSTTTSQPARD